MIMEIKKIREDYIENRKQELAKGVVTIDVHMGTCGIAAGANTVFAVLEEESKRTNYENIRLRMTGCAGLCSMEPMMTVQLPGQIPVKYGKLDAGKTREIFFSHILGGHPKAEYAIGQGFEKPQQRIEAR